MGLFLQKSFQDEEDVVLVDGLFRGDVGEDVVQEVVDVVGVAFEKVVGEGGGTGEDFPAGFAELVTNEGHVLLPGNPVQVQLLDRVVEGFRRGVEHILQDVAVAAGEDEPAVVHRLDIGSEEGLDVLFGVFVNLLEFVDGENAGEIGLFQVGEDFSEREFGGVDVAELDVEGGDARDGIVGETSCQ